MRDFESTHVLNDEGTPLVQQFMVWCLMDIDPEYCPDGELYLYSELTDFGYVKFRWESIMRTESHSYPHKGML